MQVKPADQLASFDYFLAVSHVGLFGLLLDESCKHYDRLLFDLSLLEFLRQCNDNRVCRTLNSLDVRVHAIAEWEGSCRYWTM